MTTAARVALRDCEAALEDLRAEPKGLQWRTRWAAAISLLRTVGYVLDKVDSQSDRAIEAANQEMWAALNDSKPEPAIFWRFIDQERNNLLKEYQFSAKQHVTIGLPTIVSPGPMGGQPTTIPADTPARYDHVMEGGPFHGQDPRDVVQKAIDWWKEYLDSIDKRAAEIRGTAR